LEVGGENKLLIAITPRKEDNDERRNDVGPVNGHVDVSKDGTTNSKRELVKPDITKSDKFIN
jgi:hypothetical protein